MDLLSGYSDSRINPYLGGGPALSADQINQSMWGMYSPAAAQQTFNQVTNPLTRDPAYYAGVGAAYGRATGGFNNPWVSGTTPVPYTNIGGLGSMSASPSPSSGPGGGPGGGGGGSGSMPYFDAYAPQSSGGDFYSQMSAAQSQVPAWPSIQRQLGYDPAASAALPLAAPNFGDRWNTNPYAGMSPMITGGAMPPPQLPSSGRSTMLDTSYPLSQDLGFLYGFDPYRGGPSSGGPGGPGGGLNRFSGANVAPSFNPTAGSVPQNFPSQLSVFDRGTSGVPFAPMPTAFDTGAAAVPYPRMPTAFDTGAAAVPYFNFSGTPVGGPNGGPVGGPSGGDLSPRGAMAQTINQNNMSLRLLGYDPAYSQQFAPPNTGSEFAGRFGQWGPNAGTPSQYYTGTAYPQAQPLPAGYSPLFNFDQPGGALPGGGMR